VTAAAITGRTRVAAVIGHPVQHSLSPALHNAGFASLGLEWAYVAFDVAEGRAPAALEAMRTLGLGGLSVTMPHKEAVAAMVDELDPAAAALGSVNTVVARDGRLIGHSTDGNGFVASVLAAGHGVTGRRICVLGAGGAARSIVEALARHGAAEIVVINRSAAPASRAAALAGRVGRVGVQADVLATDIVVNATSVGMSAAGAGAEGGGMVVDPALLRAGHVVADIVYHPRRTPLLAAAEATGAAIVDGLGMLVHQAVLQQQLWTGLSPDVGAMVAAAERELAERHE
jgi:shikimate dehydrogenase